MEAEAITEGIMIFLFPAAIMVLWWFYKKDTESRDKRIEKLEENVQVLTEVSTKLDTMIMYHDRDIVELKEKA